jgi:Dihydroorotate dehydrogenase
MISLNNGYQSQFFSASGAMGWLDGWPWEQPFKWLGAYDPTRYTIIVKTLTWEPRKGNLKLWPPWAWRKCIRFLDDDGNDVGFLRGINTVNAVGLTNPSLRVWHRLYYRKLLERPELKVVLSVLVESEEEAKLVAEFLNPLAAIVGVQLNVSCPNIQHKENWGEQICKIAECFIEHCRHTIILKLGWQDDIVDICKALDGKAVFELINAVPWNFVFPTKPSPLAKYNLMGAVSGPKIKPFAREALQKVRDAGVKGQIISGGGNNSLSELDCRHDLGANGFAVGIKFLLHISKVDRMFDWRSPEAYHIAEP